MVLRAGAVTPTLLYTDPSSIVIDITTDDAFVYWYGFSRLPVCAACDGGGATSASEVRRMPLAGGAVDILFGPEDGSEIFVAGGDVFTLLGDFSVRYRDLDDVARRRRRRSRRRIRERRDASVYWTVAGDGTADPTTGKLLRLAL